MNSNLNPSKLIIAIISWSFIALFFINHYDLDFYFTDKIYNIHGAFIYKNAWLTAELLHRYIRVIIIGLFLIFAIRTYQNHKGKDSMYQNMVLVFSILAGTALIAISKKLFNVDCPWDLMRYGGTKPFHSIFNYPVELLPSKHCFPAAHSGLGFTFISVYFYCSLFAKKYQYWALSLAILVGFSFGILQQIRGAHFISHDFSSLILSTTINFIIYRFAFREKRQTPPKLCGATKIDLKNQI